MPTARPQSFLEFTTLSVKVQPRSARTGVSGFMEDGSVKIRLNAPPVDGKANEALIQFLADALGVSRSAVEIKSGQTSRNKLVRIEGLSAEVVRKTLEEKMSG